MTDRDESDLDPPEPTDGTALAPGNMRDRCPVCGGRAGAETHADGCPVAKGPVEPARPVGRPTKLTPELTFHVAKALRAGAYLETAAAYVGVAKAQLYKWLRRAVEDDAAGRVTLHTEFRDAVERALADGEMRDVLRIDTAASRFWQAAAWRLERRHPERYGLAQRIRVEGEKQIEALLDVLERELPTDRFRAVVEALHRGSAPSDGEAAGQPARRQR